MSFEHGASQTPPEQGPRASAPAEAGDGQLRAMLDQARAREALLEQRLVQLEADLATVYRSHSWRLTAPIRIASARFERLRRSMRAGRTSVSGRNLSRIKRGVRARAEAELDAFLSNPERLLLPEAAMPRVSILIVLFNQAALTLACLRAISAKVDIPAEVVIVDNASSDRTSALLDRLDGARIIRNSENRHFLNAVNQAAELAKGDALLLLNNDACLREGALKAAWDALCAYPDAGAVGGPIVLPDGTLQEAGSIIWNDGSCVGYGRGCDPTAPEFQFVREVDYCSGAFLLIRRTAFEELDGLDPAFSPAYYEEADFCMRLRTVGQRVLYDPRAVIDHFEFASAGSATRALDLQREHHRIFFERHQVALAANHTPPGTSLLSARMRGGFRGRVLVIEDRVPFPSLGAGYPRSARLLHELAAAGWFVTLYPLLFASENWDEIRAKFPATIEVILDRGESGLGHFLQERQTYYDVIMVCRPHNMQRFLEACGQSLPAARVVYDAEAIFADRELGKIKLSGTIVSPSREQELLAEELRLASAAQTVVTVSDRDADRFRGFGHHDVKVLSYALVPEPTQQDHASRADILFVGALDDDPSPNTDSLLWFTSEVMPQLDALIGNEYRLLVAGRCRAERIAKLAGRRILLLGRVEDLSSLYASARLFIAPTRYAAGIPLKIYEAAARGVPVVARSLLAAQLVWQDGKELLTGDTPQAFATACARLYRDAALWQQVREAALARVAQDCDQVRFAHQVSEIIGTSAPIRTKSEQQSEFITFVPVRSGTSFWSRLARPAQRAAAALRYLRTNGWEATAQRLATELRSRFGKRDYATWIRLYDTLRPADRPAIVAHIDLLIERPTFLLMMLVDEKVSPDALRATLDSVLEQIYPDWQLSIVQMGNTSAVNDVLKDYVERTPHVKVLQFESEITEAAARNAVVSLANEDFVIAIVAGHRLRPHTLYMLAIECNAYPDATLIYADEDIGGERQEERWDPNFKPSWSPELLLYPDWMGMGETVAMRRDALIGAGGYRGGFESLTSYDLLVRVAGANDPASFRHIPRILHHRGAAAASVSHELLNQILTEHAMRIGEAVDLDTSGGAVRIAYRVQDPPLVSVIIPTRDQAALLRRCVAGLLTETDYPQIELIIVDNDSLDPAARQLQRGLAEDSRVKVLPFSYPFNYAAMNNLAVAQAHGEIIALLNNDIAVRDPGWLREMVSHALRPGVGAVGAKLYYEDGTIQHAGVVTGMLGVAGHPFRHMDGKLDGLQARLKRVRTVSAVTAACMVLRRAVYEELGGLDEVNLPVSYNDVDLCLRLRARGYRIVWTPYAELDHLESRSRGQDSSPENHERAQRESRYMQRRWGPVLSHDPFYSPNLTLSAENGGLAFPPRIAWPWRSVRS